MAKVLQHNRKHGGEGRNSGSTEAGESQGRVFLGRRPGTSLGPTEGE